MVRNEKGIAAIFMALAMFALVFLVGLGLDVGYAYLAKSELQNAADAGALAGAGALYPNTSPTTPALTSPDWNSASTSASTIVKNNKAVGANLTDNDVVSIQVGYWNLNQTPSGMQSQSTVPRGKCSISGNVCTKNADCTATASEECLIQDVPAVLVTVQKSGGVPTFFAKVLGWDSFSPAATAVAARGYPLSALDPFPVAVTKCMTDQYFSQSPLPTPPTTITITGPYGPGGAGCNTGQWTSLKLDSNNVPTIEGLMYGSIASSVTFGDDIWIEPGTKDKVYQDVRNDFVGKTVLLPVVENVADNTHAQMPVLAFVAFKITDAQTTGSTKTISGQFLDYYVDPNASRPGGAPGNTLTPPILIK